MKDLYEKVKKYNGKLKDTVNNIYSGIKNTPKYLSKHAAPYALALAALVPYSQEARAQLSLADYQSTTTTDVYHVSANKTGPVWDGIPNFIGLTYALSNNYSTSTTLPVRVHISEGIWKREDVEHASYNVQSNMQLVGRGNSLIRGDYSQGINAPSNTGVELRSSVELQNKSRIDLVNLFFKPEGGGECLMFGNVTTATVYNSFFGDLISIRGARIAGGITIGQTSSGIICDNNVFFRMYDPATDSGAGVSIRGQGKFRNNIFAESKYGIDITRPTDMDIGKVGDPGNNVFVGNLTENIKANIGDINQIYSQLNTWYPVNTVSLLTTKSQEKNYGVVLNDEQSIKDTILIEDPTISSLDTQLKNPSRSLQEFREIIVKPWNFGDQRFGYIPINSIRKSWHEYE